MRLSTLLGINAVLALLFGLGFLIAPGPMLSAYGATPSPELAQMARFFGSGLLGYAILTWLARGITDAGARRAIVLSLILSFGVGFVVAVWGQISGVVHALGWLTVALYLVFGLGYASLQAAGKT
jgi:hypothetical protein